MPARTASAIILALIERRRAAARLVSSSVPCMQLGRLLAAAGSWAPSLTAWGGSPKWPHSPEGAILPIGGAVAQLGERLVRNEEVTGSTPLGSTNLRGCTASVGRPASPAQVAPRSFWAKGGLS